MAQERYNAKTKTGWKFEKGKSFYYLKGKKLSTKEVVARGLSPLTNFAKKVVEPLTEGAKNIAAGNTTWRRHPDSKTGESYLEYNTRKAKEQLAIQKKLDKNPNVIANQTAASTLSPSQYFGTGNFGDKATQTANIRNIDNMQISAEHRRNVAKDPFNVKHFMPVAISNAGTGFVKPGEPGFNLQRDVISNQGSTSESIVGKETSNTLRINKNDNQATPKAPIVKEKETRQALRSDVFTLDENNVPLGVMTRAQRRAWDANPDNQKLMRRRKEELRIPSRTYSSGNIGTGSG